MDTVQAAVRKLQRPEGMQRPAWARLKKILRVLAEFLPNPYPSIGEVAERAGISTSATARLLIRAEAEGLISRTPRPVPRGHDSYFYALTFIPPSDPVTAEGGNEEEITPKGLSRESSPLRGESRGLAGGGRPIQTLPDRKEQALLRLGVKLNRRAGRCYVCGEPVGAREGFLHGPLPVHSFCSTGVCDTAKLERYLMDKGWQKQDREDREGPPAFGEDPNPPQPTAVVSSNPAARLAYRFESLWTSEVLKQFPAWRGQYRWGQHGPAIGYIRSQFLTKGYSADHVEAFIEAFVDEILAPGSELAPREGQTAWQLFTAWWGRVPVPDPAIAREAQEIMDQAVSQAAREQTAKQAARERVFAADDAGEEPTEEDLRAAGFPVSRRRP